jgi:hypothetical protein
MIDRMVNRPSQLNERLNITQNSFQKQHQCRFQLWKGFPISVQPHPLSGF